MLFKSKYPVGTIRKWNGVDYKKGSDGKWKPVPKKNDIPVFTEEGYLASKGASRQDIGDSAFHKNKGRHSDKTWKKMVDGQAQKDHELIIRRARLREEYNSLIEQGKIRAPSKRENLAETAAGHPDNEATQAAQRLLARLEARIQAHLEKDDTVDPKIVNDTDTQSSEVDYAYTPTARSTSRIFAYDDSKIKPSIKDAGDLCLKYTANKYEQAIILNPSGQYIYYKKGTTNTVEFTPEEAVKMKGSHMVHNHPSNTGLSGQDMILAIVQELGSITAVSEDKHFRYSPPIGLVNEIQKEVESLLNVSLDSLRFTQKQTALALQVKQKIDFYNGEIRKDLQALVDTNMLQPMDASMMHQSLLGELIAKNVGGKYDEWDR